MDKTVECVKWCEKLINPAHDELNPVLIDCVYYWLAKNRQPMYSLD